MVEQLTVNQLVAGSNPVSGAKKKHQMILVFFLALETGSNQAFCVSKKWFGEVRQRTEACFEHCRNEKGFSRYPVSGAKKKDEIFLVFFLCPVALDSNQE